MVGGAKGIDPGIPENAVVIGDDLEEDEGEGMMGGVEVSIEGRGGNGELEVDWCEGDREIGREERLWKD